MRDAPRRPPPLLLSASCCVPLLKVDMGNLTTPPAARSTAAGNSHSGETLFSLAMACLPIGPPPLPSATPEVTLFAPPVTNYAARVRFVAATKGLLTSRTVVVAPSIAECGLDSDAYHAVRPFARVPVAVVHNYSDGSDVALYENPPVVEYIVDAYAYVGASFTPPTRTTRARAQDMATALEEHVGPDHPAMPKTTYGVDADERAASVARLRAALDSVEDALDPIGPFAVGPVMSMADVALLGNWPFYYYMLPTSSGDGPMFGRPRLAAWAAHMLNSSVPAREVCVEVHKALGKLWAGGSSDQQETEAVAPPSGLAS